MQDYFIQLFGYDKWATTRLLEIFDQKPAGNPRINELLSHMQSTQRIWLDRCQGRKETVQRFQERTQETIWSELQSCHKDWVVYIQSLQPADFTSFVNYTNFQGDHLTSMLQDIITQITNHGTHHRGTIIALMKEEAYPPPNLDYISYVRLLQS
jgi:uncharacterized damage-inducible protein DinB